MKFDLENKRIIITGGSSGLGLDIAKHFADVGAKCILLARDGEKLKTAVNSLSGTGHKYYCIDLMKFDETKKVILEIIDKHEITVCVHNVGGTFNVKKSSSSFSNWDNVWRFNVGTAININEIIIPHMIKNKYGRITHISSISAISLRGSGPYACMKTLLNSYIKTLGRELATHPIVVSGVMPGAIFTEGGHWDEKSEMNINNKDQFERKKYDFLRHHHAIGRLGMVNEISPWVIFLSSKYSTFANGTIIEIDGGTM